MEKVTFEDQVTQVLGGDYKDKDLGQSSPDLFQTPKQRAMLLRIGMLLDRATEPVTKIEARIRNEVRFSLLSTQLPTMTRSTESVLAEMVDHEIYRAYLVFLQYLAKVQEFVDENRRRPVVSGPSESFLKAVDYDKITLREWIVYVELFSSQNGFFNTAFGYKNITDVLRNLMVTDREAFLGRTIKDILSDARAAGFLY